MGTSLWMVTTRCTDPAREAEFNRWYDEVHLPDLLSVPHIVAAQRYTLAGPPSQTEPGAQYLAVYELDTDDPQAVVQTVFAEYSPQWRAAQRTIDCIALVSSTTFTARGARKQATVAAAGD